MRALLDGRPEYQKVKIIRVDWDTHRSAAFVAELRIPRRSTLVVFKGGQEVARVVARTSPDDIEALFKAVM